MNMEKKNKNRNRRIPLNGYYTRFPYAPIPICGVIIV